MALTEADFNKLSEKERLNSTLEGEIYFAWLSKPKISERFKTIAYQLNLGVDDANAEKAISLGLKVNPPDKWNPKQWVEIKRKVKDPNKVADAKPDVVDAMQQPVSDNVIIGNGSQGIVKFGRYWYPNNGGGIGTVLFKVQVRQLVEYKPKDTTFVMDPDGYKAANAEPMNAKEELMNGSAEFDT